MEWAPHREFLEEVWRNTGVQPDALANEPELEENLAAYLDAFFTLSSSRPIGMAPGGIPLTEIECACRMLHVEQIGRFVEFIQAMDSEFLSYCGQQAKAAQ